MIDVQEFIEMFRHYPLMKTAEQEKFLKIIRTPPPGVPEDASEWIYTPEQEAAREEFLCRNIRLVIHTVKKFGRIEDPKMIDLIGAGCIGLVKGVDAFDVSKRMIDPKGNSKMYKFSTYATHWIRAEIFKQLKVHDSKVLKYKTLYNELKRLRRDHLKQRRFKTDEELFLELGWDEETINKYQSDEARLKISLDTLDTNPQDYSDVDSSLVTEAPQDELLEAIFKEEVKVILYDALKTLTDIQKQVLAYRYGFADDRQKGLTYDQVADNVGLTREKVKQIEGKALAELWYFMRERAPSLCE